MNSTKNLRTAAVAALLGLGAAATAPAQVPVTGVSGGATLGELAGTSTLVTVVLGSGASETNCQVAEVAPTYLAVLSDDGLRNAYLFSDIAEVHVQGGEIMGGNRDLSLNRPLSDAEQRLYADVQARARELFEHSLGDQGIRMRVAALVALDGDEQGLTYLQQRAEGNDLYTALRANLELALIGQASPDPELIRGGLSSGLRNVRTATIYCIGLLGLEDFEGRLLTLLKERAAEISAPSAFALGRLKSEAAIPSLLEMVTSLNEQKAETAKEALIHIGGDAVLTGLKERLPNVAGLTRFRLVEALFLLGDPLGERILKDEAMGTPTLSVQAAMVLVQEGDFEAREFLQARIDEKYEPTLINQLQRIYIAAALIKAGDRKNVAVIQEALGSDSNPALQYTALSAIAEVGERFLADLAMPLVGSTQDEVATFACQAVVACLKPEYGDKYRATFAQLNAM